MSGIKFFALLAGAALAEIAGCYAFWLWLRQDQSPLWVLPGTALLVVFAMLLTMVNIDAAGRAYAVYGGIYIIIALFWLWLIEGTPPDRSDLAGAAVCLLGTAIIAYGRRSVGQ
jgi:small multidrug resistance family-3 protein